LETADSPEPAATEHADIQLALRTKSFANTHLHEQAQWAQHSDFREAICDRKFTRGITFGSGPSFAKQKKPGIEPGFFKSIYSSN